MVGLVNILPVLFFSLLAAALVSWRFPQLRVYDGRQAAAEA
jgi:hypothetical protein